MTFGAFFPESARASCPRHPAFPHVAQSVSTRIYPAPYASELGPETAGRVVYTEYNSIHRPHGIGWWQRVQWLALWWRRWALGPLLGGQSDYLSDGLNLIQSDTAFNIVSVSGNKIRLQAPSSSFDARKWAVGVRIVENSLWFPGNGATRYLFRPYYGSAQLGDEVIFHPNSVLFVKSRPMIVDIERAEGDQDWDNYTPGDDFVIVIDQDATNATVPVNSEGDAPASLWIRTHTLEPMRWKPLLENRPFYAVQVRRRWRRAEIDALDNGVAVLTGRAGQSGRIARPIQSTTEGIASLFRARVFDAFGNETEITTAMLAEGRLACVHDGEDGYLSRAWIGAMTPNGPASHLVPEGGAIELDYWFESQGGVAVCQSRCHYARVDNVGRTYCARAFDGMMDEQNETWVEQPPTGLANFRAECYQWGAGGCDKFTDRTPTGLSDWDGFWRQLWCESGVRVSQVAVGIPQVYIERFGVEGLLQMGGARLDRAIELGVVRKTLAQDSKIGYLDGTDWVQGLCNTYQAAIGPDYDSPSTWGPPSLLRVRGVTTAIPTALGSPWDATNDPDRGNRDYPLIPAVKAESFTTAGRSAREAVRLLEYQDVLPGALNLKDGTEQVGPGQWRWVSETNGNLRLRWEPANPLGVWDSAVGVSGTITNATLVDGLIQIEIANTWRTVTFLQETDHITGTILAGGTFVRPHAMFELVNDSGHGDGCNPTRGCQIGDMLTISGDGTPQSIAANGFEVVKALPFEGASEGPGWNGDPAGTPPNGLFVPTNFMTWGLRRDVVWVRPRGVIGGGNLSSIVGKTATATQTGVWAGPDKPRVWTSPRKQNNWTELTSFSVNYRTGEITLNNSDLAAFGAEPFDIRVRGTVYDRRSAVRADHMNLIPKVFSAMDTIRIVPSGNIEGLIGFAQHEENVCQAGDWGYWDNGWVSNSFLSFLYPAALPGNPKVFHDFDKIGDRRTGISVNVQAPGYGFGPVGLSTLPDGTQISSAVVRFKTGFLYHRETVEEYFKGSTSPNITVTESTTEAPISAALYARRPDGSYTLFGSSLSIPAQVNDWGLLDITSLVQNYLDYWRRSEFDNFGVVLLPPGFADMPLPKKEYSSYAPQKVNCNLPENNNQFGGGTSNPDYVANRAFKIRYHYLEYGGVNFDSIIVRFSSLPTTISGRSLVNCRPITNEHANYRRTWPWKQP